MPCDVFAYMDALRIPASYNHIGTASWLNYFDPADKFTVPSFLEALEDSVARTSGSEESADLKSQTLLGSDKMDEGQ